MPGIPVPDAVLIKNEQWKPLLNHVWYPMTAKHSVFTPRSATKPEIRLREKVEEVHVLRLFVASYFCTHNLDLLQICNFQ